MTSCSTGRPRNRASSWIPVGLVTFTSNQLLADQVEAHEVQAVLDQLGADGADDGGFGRRELGRLDGADRRGMLARTSSSRGTRKIRAERTALEQQHALVTDAHGRLILLHDRQTLALVRPNIDQ
jgi:hypothetical protein